MGDPVILREEDVGRIVEYAKPWMRELVDQMIPRREFAGVGGKLLERMVRVEEELKAQRVLMDERFGFMERRFEAIDKRFEDLIGNMDKRFEAVDKRFEGLDRDYERAFRGSHRPNEPSFYHVNMDDRRRLRRYHIFDDDFCASGVICCNLGIPPDTYFPKSDLR